MSRPIGIVEDLHAFLSAGLTQHARDARRAILLGEVGDALKQPRIKAQVDALAKEFGVPPMALVNAVALVLVEARQREGDARAAVLGMEAKR